MKNSSRLAEKIARNLMHSTEAFVLGLRQRSLVEIQPAQVAVNPHL